MKKSILMILFLFLIGCGTVQYKNDYQQTGQEIDDILKHDKNLTPEQRVILKHARTELKAAENQDKKNSDLQHQVVSNSKLAGTGKLIYVIIGVICLITTAYIITKIKSLL